MLARRLGAAERFQRLPSTRGDHALDDAASRVECVPNETYAAAVPVSYTHLTLPTNREV